MIHTQRELWQLSRELKILSQCYTLGIKWYVNNLPLDSFFIYFIPKILAKL